MGYVYTGYKRSLSITVTKTINGVASAGYPKTYPTATDIANGYFTYSGTNYSIPPNGITEEAFAQLDTTVYNSLLAAFQLYVLSLEPGLNFTTHVTNSPTVYDAVTCPPGAVGTTTSTTPSGTTSSTTSASTTSSTTRTTTSAFTAFYVFDTGFSLASDACNDVGTRTLKYHDGVFALPDVYDSIYNTATIGDYASLTEYRWYGISRYATGLPQQAMVVSVAQQVYNKDWCNNTTTTTTPVGTTTTTTPVATTTTTTPVATTTTTTPVATTTTTTTPIGTTTTTTPVATTTTTTP